MANALREFVQKLSQVLDVHQHERDILQAGSSLLAALVARDGWLPDAYARPDPARYQQYLLHADSAGRFSVVSFVWAPGQQTPIHDHGVWGLVAVLRGAELSQGYRLGAAGVPEPVGSPVRLAVGQIEAISPATGDIHRVSNALAHDVSVSIHVYGANIGAVRRSTYGLDGRRTPFVSGYSNTTLPNIWDLSKEISAS